MPLNSEDYPVFGQMGEQFQMNVTSSINFDEILELFKRTVNLDKRAFCYMVLEAKKAADDMELDIELERVIVEHNNQLINDGDIEADEFSHRLFYS
jgi:hypothetical protein